MSVRKHRGSLESLVVAWVAATAGLGLAPVLAHAQAVGPLLRAVAVSDDPAPDGDGEFNTFQQPSINDAGEISFAATFSGSFDVAGILVERSSGLEIVARSNDPAPDGNGVLFSFGTGAIPINASGVVAFASALFDASGGATPRIFTSDGQTLRQVVSRGQPAPDGNGSFGGFDSLGIQNDGDASFWTFFQKTSGGFTVDDRGVYRGDGVTDLHPAPLEEVIRSGEAIGGGVTVGNVPENLASNRTGWIAIPAFLNNTPNPSVDSATLFVDDGAVRSQRVTSGEESPDENGTIFGFTVPIIASDGRAAVAVTFNGSDGGLSDNMGVASYAATGGPPDKVLVREGDPVPDGEGDVFVGDFDGAFGFASTQVAPNRLLVHAGEGGSAPNQRGLLLSRDGDLSWVAREGDTTPGDDGEFALLRLDEAHINPAQGIVFFATVVNHTSRGDGIFAWTPSTGLSSIARVGQPLLGSTIQAVFMMDDTEARLAGNSPLNAFGDLTFRVRLEDGREAIIATHAPEPGAALSGLAALLAVAALRGPRSRPANANAGSSRIRATPRRRRPSGRS